jgi:excisionase family DNA binding protein
MTSNASEDRLLTVREAGQYLGFAEGTLYNKASRDEIPHVRLGRSLRFRKSELDRWIIEQDAAAADAA